MLVYATAAELATWMDADAPDNATALLRQASILVGRACRNDLYDVDGSGKPSDPDLVEAMRDAVCAQAEYWVVAKVNPIAGAGGVVGVITEVTLDGATRKADTTAAVAAATEAVTSTTILGSVALSILRNAGLASSYV